MTIKKRGGRESGGNVNPVAAGRTTSAAAEPAAHHMWHQHGVEVFSDCPFCLKRIVELEAELAEFKAERKAKHFVHSEFSCAEADRRRKKAEAEVERLKLRNAELEAWIHKISDEDCHADIEAFMESVGSDRVNPSGDTLGGGGRESGRSTGCDVGPVSESSLADRTAAEPAAQSLSARKATPKTGASFYCGICNVWFDEYADLQNHPAHEAAVRKERDARIRELEAGR